MMTLAAIHLHLTSYPAPTSLAAIDYACALAKFFEARLNVSSSRLIVQTPRNWMVAGAMSKMAREIEAITSARTDALELHVQREAMLLGLQTRISHAQEFWPGGLVDNAWRGRVGDLCVLGLAPDGGASRLYVEDWLFGAGRPCLLYPDTSEQAFAIDNILICWDFSKSAARTVSDGLPLLHNAKRIRVAVFRGEKGIAIDDPATPLVVFLADHGIVVESEDVLVGKRTIGQAIVDHARATDTHLIMTGAFGHSRLQEFVLGGATRELLNTSTIPLLMSH